MKINGAITDLLPRETLVLRRGERPLELHVSAYPLDWLLAAEQEWESNLPQQHHQPDRSQEIQPKVVQLNCGGRLSAESSYHELAYLKAVQAFYWAVREDIGPGKTLEFETRWENDAPWFYRSIATELTAVGFTYGDIESVILKAMELSGLAAVPGKIV